ncbi:ATP-binding protein [Roseibium sp.]|uniref:hybrid sensor histidine kinase/response regulator n=1 Tax=Roseibium sp. TaxID=1936156 RepID=UPI003D1527DA
MVRPVHRTRNLIRHLKRNPHLAAICLVFCVAVLLEIALASSIIDENRKHYQSDLSGFLQSVNSDVSAVVIGVKDLTVKLLSEEEREAEQDFGKYRKIPPFIKDIGHLFSDDLQSRHSLLASEIAFGAEAHSYARFVGRLASEPGNLLLFAKSDFPELFRNLHKEYIVVAQAVPVSREWGLRLSRENTERHLITYAVMDLNAAIRAAEKKLKHTSIEEIRYSLNATTFDVKNRRRDDIVPLFLKGDTETFSIPLSSNASLGFSVREYDGNMLVHLYFVLGFALLIFVTSVFLAHVRRSARKLRQEQVRAMKEAVRANNVKSEFLATMSHEIRTPLNGILGLAEVLNRSELTPVQKRYTRQIMSSGSMLLGILNDVLDMSKLESGKMDISPERINLHTQLLEIASFYYPNARKKQIDLHVNVDHSVPEYTELDPMRLRQVIGNLLSNAIKFTTKGEVILSARFVYSDTCPSPANGWLLVDVKDTGIGMEQKEIDKLFQRFVQANSSMSRKFGGTGLGLSISNLIAKAMGGNILVQSTRGIGSTFILRLPIESGDTAFIPYEGNDRIAVLTTSATNERLLRAAFAPLGLEVTVFDYDENTLKQVFEDADANGPFRVVMFDEEHDVQRAIDDWQALKKHFGASISSVVVGDKQLSKNYAHFDRAIIKPFLPLRLAETVVELISGEDRNVTLIEPSATANPLHNAFAGCRMLAIDDNQVNLLVVEEMFSDYGFVIDTVNDGQKALARIETKPYDIVLMDCQMPVMDGYEATRRMRKMMAEGTTSRCPIVAITANALKGDREKCISAGMDDFLAKPMQDDAIRQMFERLLENPEFRACLAPKTKLRKTADVLRLPATTPLTAVEEQTTAENSASQDAAPSAGIEAQDGKDRGPLMDLHVFQRTRRSMKKFDTLVSFYRADTRNYLAALEEAIDSGRLDEGVLPAHTLKSSSNILGATGLATLAEAMERRLRSDEKGSPEELKAQLDKMNDVCTATLTQIDRLMCETPRNDEEPVSAVS